MGAGASLDQSQRRSNGSAGEGRRFYCHECHRTFLPLSGDQSPQSMRCSFCDSTFLEEMEVASPISYLRRRHFDLSDEQTRRLTSAAALLQMLELQLRDELEMLQSSLSGGSEVKTPPFTQGMRDTLKNVKTSVAMICEQPSCPICSEDYTEQEPVMKLPCDHIFHKDCVMPWLESKRTCPICRFEVKHTVVPCGELEQLSKEELKYRISARVDLDDIIEQENNAQLAARLHKFLTEEQEQLDEHEEESRNEAAGEGERGRVVLLSASDLRSSVMGRGGGLLGRSFFSLRSHMQEEENGEGREDILPVDNDNDEDEANSGSSRQPSDGIHFGSIAGQHIRVINYSSRGRDNTPNHHGISRMIISSSVGHDEEEDNIRTSGPSGLSSSHLDGMRGVGSSEHNTIVFRRRNSGETPPVATLMTEANQPNNNTPDSPQNVSSIQTDGGVPMPTTYIVRSSGNGATTTVVPLSASVVRPPPDP